MSYSFSKEQLDNIFKDIGKELKKKLKNKKFSYELIIVGGASILLNYSFRMSTIDIDCLDVNDALMNEIINEITNKYQLPNGWINTDFTKTNSYTPKLIQYSSFYKSYSNGALVVRTIKDEYLIAMKMVAARKYKHDYSDIYGIIKENKALTFDKIKTSITNLYGNTDVVSEEMMSFVEKLFSDSSLIYSDIEKQETETKETLLKKYSNK